MRYIVPQEIKSETKVAKNIYIFDFFFLMIYIGASALLANAVTEALLFVYWIFTIVMALSLIGRSRTNPKRRNYQAIFIYLKKDRNIYRPMPNFSKMPEEKELYL